MTKVTALCWFCLTVFGGSAPIKNYTIQRVVRFSGHRVDPGFDAEGDVLVQHFGHALEVRRVEAAPVLVLHSLDGFDAIQAVDLRSEASQLFPE